MMGVSRRGCHDGCVMVVYHDVFVMMGVSWQCLMMGVSRWVCHDGCVMMGVMMGVPKPSWVS